MLVTIGQVTFERNQLQLY